VLVTEAHKTALDILSVDLAPRASGKLPTVRSLKIAELDQGDWRIGIAFKMAGLAHHKRHQLRVRACSPGSDVMMAKMRRLSR
jgi:hypothetical protein